jgi:SpoVK/Ycf46/Vps4 family AAA+-type ATPase
LARLFQTISSSDWSAAEAAATQIIRDEEQKKHHSAAQMLRGALRPNGRNGQNGHSEAWQPAAPMIAGALTKQTSTARLSDVMLSAHAKSELQLIVKEWKSRARLQSVGIARRSRLFFHGPPGCGKSMTACVLGNELGLPVFLVRFDAIIGAYLGQTAIHLRQLFHFAETTPAILLLDEVDALAKRRGSPLDVGELDRIVIALLQELEHSRPMGFVIATSNLAVNIDSALWRRFDLSLEFRKPRPAGLSKYAAGLIKSLRVRTPKAVLRRARQAGSYAEVRSMIEAAARRALLESA